MFFTYRMPSIEDILFRSGDLFLPTYIRNILEYHYIGDKKSVFFITNWSFLHFLSGVLIAYYLTRRTSNIINVYLYSFTIHNLWEIWQILIRNTPIQTLRGKVDVLVDTLLYMFGVYFYIECIGRNKK